jgi:transposase
MTAYFLPNTKEFGLLSIIKEYYRYDVPRAFVVHSKKVNKDFLVYWADEFEDSDMWYYVNFNATEQERVENGQIHLRDVFSLKNVHQIKTYFDVELPAELIDLNYDQVDLESLPPEGFAVKKVSETEYVTYKRPVNSFESNEEYHEIRLSKNDTTTGKKAISWNSVQDIFGSWETVYRTIIDSLNLKGPSFQPALSGVGSFKMQFKTAHNQELVLKASEIFEVLINSKGSLDELKKFDIDLSTVESLLTNLSTYNLKFELRTNSGNILSSIDTTYLEDTARSLNEYTQGRVGSESIPQADEISRVITLVNKKYVGRPFNSTTEKLVERQISYYISAARMLGLTKLGGQLTPIGQKLAESENPKEEALILIDLFERSVCGWAWLKYSDVKSVFELSRDSAVSFLLEKSAGLSENTAKRRAVTLRKWLDVFKGYKDTFNI